MLYHWEGTHLPVEATYTKYCENEDNSFIHDSLDKIKKK